MSYICTLRKHSEIETASAEPSAHLCNEDIWDGLQTTADDVKVWPIAIVRLFFRNNVTC